MPEIGTYSLSGGARLYPTSHNAVIGQLSVVRPTVIVCRLRIDSRCIRP
jgi:hypothetical protein